KLDDGMAGGLRGEELEGLPPEELVHGQARLRGVRLDRRRADPRLRREPGQHRREGDAETGAVRLLLGVAGDEALRRLGSRVAAAEWRSVQRGAAAEDDDAGARPERPDEG